jgi:hypothetical protein
MMVTPLHAAPLCVPDLPTANKPETPLEAPVLCYDGVVRRCAKMNETAAVYVPADLYGDRWTIEPGFQQLGAPCRMFPKPPLSRLREKECTTAFQARASVKPTPRTTAFQGRRLVALAPC